jgi:HPt (histidine-containing phosphotransfer) domain-containing protein
MKDTTVNPKIPYLVQADPLVRPLVPDYLKNRANDVQRLKDALAAKDFPVLRKIGHNMRGSAGAYGLPPLSEIGGRIEDAALAQDAGAIAAALEDMRQFLDVVKMPTP